MTNRRDVLKGLGIAAALPASETVVAAPSVKAVRKQVVTRIRIGLSGANLFTQPDDEKHYWAKAWEDDGLFYDRAKGVTIEVSEQRYRMVLLNPHLYYSSSALRLHYQIIGELKKQGLRS